MSQDANQAFASPEDEDLFDFPVSSAYAGGDNASDRGQAPPIQAQAGPKPSSARPTSAAAPVDFDLDEDLFNFGALFDESQPLSAADAYLDLEDSLPSAAPIQPKGPGKPAPASAPTAAATPTPQQPKAPGVAAAQPGRVPRPVEPAPQTTPIAEPIPSAMWAPPQLDLGPEPKRGRLLEILALSFLVLNTALVLLAWRAGDHFRETLASVTRTVSDAVADGHAQGQSNQPQVYGPSSTVSSISVAPQVTQTVVESQKTSEVPTSLDQAPSDLLDLPQASLELARERIRKGRFTEARRGLFRLLANRDRTALDDELVIAAERLVAEAFAAQAKEATQ